MAKELIKVGDETLEIEVKPITLICTSPDIRDEIQYVDRVKLTPEYTVYHAERTQTFDPRTPALVAMVFGCDSDVVTPDWCRSKDIGVLHIAGLVDLWIKLTAQGVRLVLYKPETYLHPQHQLQLADVMIALSRIV